MDDKISLTMKLMLLMTIKKFTVSAAWGDEKDVWRMLVGFLTPSDHRGARKPTVDTHLRLWGAADSYNCLNSCNFGQGDLSC